MKVYVSIIDQSLNEILCARCEKTESGRDWYTETDTLGNNFGICPHCMKESILVNDDELPYEDSRVD